MAGHFDHEVRRCCERDSDGDGNCDVHASPGVLRASARYVKNFVDSKNSPGSGPQYKMVRVLEYVGTREFIDSHLKKRGVIGERDNRRNENPEHYGIIREAVLGGMVPEKVIPEEAIPLSLMANLLDLRRAVKNFLPDSSELFELVVFNAVTLLGKYYELKTAAEKYVNPQEVPHAQI